jgi:metal-sulfur cluster biosynthetic enzyme
MTLAMQDSPGQGLVLEQVHNRLAGMQQISKVEIDLVWEPRWTPQQINAAGLKELEARSVPADPQVLVQITGVRNPA